MFIIAVLCAGRIAALDTSVFTETACEALQAEDW